MNRQEKRRQDRELEKLMLEDRFLQFYPRKIFHGDTEQADHYLLSYCPVCRFPEPSVLSLGEWSHDQKRLLCKVTGLDLDGEDDFDYFRRTCGMWNENTGQMKRLIEFFKNEKAKQDRFLMNIGVQQCPE